MVKLTPEFLFKVRATYAVLADNFRQVGHDLFMAGTQLGRAVLDVGNDGDVQSHIDLAGVYVDKLGCLKNATLTILAGLNITAATLEDIENRFDLATTKASLREGELLAASIADAIEAGEAAISGQIVQARDDGQGGIEVISETGMTDEELIRRIFEPEARIERIG